MNSESLSGFETLAVTVLIANLGLVMGVHVAGIGAGCALVGVVESALRWRCAS